MSPHELLYHYFPLYVIYNNVIHYYKYAKYCIIININIILINIKINMYVKCRHQ